MRAFIIVLVLIFSLQSWTKADDIKDFEIEGISIGDSLLDYFSEEEINNAKKHQLKTGSLELADDTGSSANYTLIGGEHSFEIKYAPKNIVRDKLVALKKRGKKIFVKAPAAPKAPAISIAAAPASSSSSGGGPSSGGGSESGDSGEGGKDENE